MSFSMVSIFLCNLWSFCSFAPAFLVIFLSLAFFFEVVVLFGCPIILAYKSIFLLRI